MSGSVCWLRPICRYAADNAGSCELGPICKYAQIGADECIRPLSQWPVVVLEKHDAAKRIGSVVKGGAKKEEGATKLKAAAKEGRAPKFTSLDPKRDDHLKYAFKALNRWAREERLDAAAQTELAYLRNECPLGAKYLIDRDRQRLVDLYMTWRGKIVSKATEEGK